MIQLFCLSCIYFHYKTCRQFVNWWRMSYWKHMCWRLWTPPNGLAKRVQPPSHSPHLAFLMVTRMQKGKGRFLSQVVFLATNSWSNNQVHPGGAISIVDFLVNIKQSHIIKHLMLTNAVLLQRYQLNHSSISFSPNWHMPDLWVLSHCDFKYVYLLAEVYCHRGLSAEVLFLIL